MPSLGEVYERDLGSKESEERLYIGFGLLATGAFLVFLGGATAVFGFVGDIIITLLAPLASLLGRFPVDQRMGVGGVLAGIGVPLAFLGIFSVLPLSKEDQEHVLWGLGLMSIGVLTFVYAYPYKWYNDPVDLTWLVFLVYATGGIIDMWVLFRSVLNIELAIPQDSLLLKYVGTEEEEKNPTSDGGAVGIETGSSVGVTGIDVQNTEKDEKNDAEFMNATSKGRGSEQFEPQTRDDAEVTRSRSSNGREKNGHSRFTGDEYCGNCAFYEYARDAETDQTVPFCKYHEMTLDDLEACEEHRYKKRTLDKI